MSSGEEKAWDILGGLDPSVVCRNARVLLDDSTGSFILRSFGMDVLVNPRERSISSPSPGADTLLGCLAYFSRLSILWYMTGARDIPLSGRLLQPVNLKGGQIFFRGTHVLPLDKLATKYSLDVEGFIRRGEQLGGERVSHGDAAIRLFPFPRVPVELILWCDDDEFPARADLLFDSTCEFHLALDVLWSTAMNSILIMC